jgi:hypothetical protein
MKSSKKISCIKMLKIQWSEENEKEMDKLNNKFTAFKIGYFN